MGHFTATNFTLGGFDTTVSPYGHHHHHLPHSNNNASWEISQLSSANLKYSTIWTAILTMAYAAIFLLGFVGNITVILVISVKARMRTVTNMFILNLAVADLLVVVFCVPVTLVANIFIPWIFGSLICKVMAYAQGVSVAASVYSLVAISVDRCRALYRPIGSPHGFTSFQAKLIILLIWLIALLITFPWLVVFNVVYSNDPRDPESEYYPFCQENWSHQLLGKVYFFGAHLTLCFLLPFLVISLVNFMIWWNVRKFRKVSLEQDLPIRYNINGITKLLCIITITFIVSWLPLYVLMAKIKLLTGDQYNNDDPNALVEHRNLTMKQGEHEEQQEVGAFVQVLIPIAQLLGSSNSCVNPLLYAFHNRVFRATVVSFCRR